MRIKQSERLFASHHFHIFLGESFERMKNNQGYLALMLLKRKKCNFSCPSSYFMGRYTLRLRKMSPFCMHFKWRELRHRYRDVFFSCWPYTGIKYSILLPWLGEFQGASGTYRDLQEPSETFRNLQEPSKTFRNLKISTCPVTDRPTLVILELLLCSYKTA